MNFLVETKHEYTQQLVNILSPLIYEGLQSIYDEAKNLASPNNVLKVFQSFIKKIPQWNKEMISAETRRIISTCKCADWLEDLIKATIKAHIMVLSFSPFTGKIKLSDPKFYQNVDIESFIHKIYVECGRDVWNNPYLFYHVYQPLDLKRNQRDTINLIKDSIREALRKMLPVRQLLSMYLGDKVEEGQENYEDGMSDISGRNIKKLVKADLMTGDNINNYGNEIIKSLTPVNPVNQSMIGGSHFGSNATAPSGSHFGSNATAPNNKTYTPVSTNQHLLSLVNKAISDSDSEEEERMQGSYRKNIQTTNVPNDSQVFDDHIANIVSDTSEQMTSITYHQNKNNVYADVFSNANHEGKKTHEFENKKLDQGSLMKGGNKKFFSNYLKPNF